MFFPACLLYLYSDSWRETGKAVERERERLGSNPGYCSKDSALYVLYQVSYQGGKPVLC